MKPFNVLYRTFSSKSVVKELNEIVKNYISFSQLSRSPHLQLVKFHEIAVLLLITKMKTIKNHFWSLKINKITFKSRNLLKFFVILTLLELK